MTNPVKPIPEGYRNLAPYLIATGASSAIAFYKAVFGAVESYRIATPDQKVLFAELRIGDSQLMVADEFIDWGIRGPKTLGGTPAMVHFYTENVDKVVEAAVAQGSEVLKQVADQFSGDRLGQIRDPFGHVWFIASRKENIAIAEIQRRAAEMFSANS